MPHFWKAGTRRPFRASAPSALGAPVVSFCRIDDKEIRLREPILEPDALIVQDPTLFKVVDVCQGLKPNGYLLVNSNRPLSELHLDKIVAQLPKAHALAVPASELALKHIGRPLPNAALLGAFAALTGIVHLKSVNAAIRRSLPGKKIAQANIAAATAAYDAVAGAAAAA